MSELNVAIADSGWRGSSKFQETFSDPQSGCAFRSVYSTVAITCSPLEAVGHRYSIFSNHTRNARTVGLQNLELSIFPQRSDTPELS
jgi:hypothetical protein